MQIQQFLSLVLKELTLLYSEWPKLNSFDHSDCNTVKNVPACILNIFKEWIEYWFYLILLKQSLFNILYFENNLGDKVKIRDRSMYFKQVYIVPVSFCNLRSILSNYILSIYIFYVLSIFNNQSDFTG